MYGFLCFTQWFMTNASTAAFEGGVFLLYFQFNHVVVLYDDVFKNAFFLCGELWNVCFVLCHSWKGK